MFISIVNEMIQLVTKILLKLLLDIKIVIPGLKHIYSA